METIYTLKKQDLKPWLESLAQDSDVYVPARDRDNSLVDFFNLSEIKDDLGFGQGQEKRYVLDLVEKTKRSPKQVMYPHWEDLLDFSYEKDPENIEDEKIKLSVSQEAPNSIIFGLKPCDCQAIARMDAVFGQGIVKDPYYMKRRENTVLISLGCDTVFEDCFCTAVGGSPYGFDHTDLGLMEDGDHYVVFVYTKKGNALAQASNSYLAKADAKDGQDYKSRMQERNKKASEKMSSMWPKTAVEDMAEHLNKAFDASQWKKVSQQCISCGACTFVCPTCYCFDIRDDKDNRQGKRYRCWDFCTSYLYTLEASGHNPREDIQKRYKNKVNCKYNYNFQRQGHLYCVGCGRCVEVCPVDMDIRQIVATVLKSKQP